MHSLARARSFLFVPGTRLERIAKALRSGAHAVIVDLEDAVLPEEKASARQGLLEVWPSIPVEDRARIMVRINASGSEWHAADTAAMTRLSAERLGGIVLPKAESVAALEQVLEATRRSPLIPLIESSAGLHAIELIARVPGVLRLAFGHLDFQLDLGLHCEPDETELTSVRLALVQASRRANLASPVDGVTVDLDDDARLAADAARGWRLGFRAKLCIHPRQVTVANDLMQATPAQRLWATRVLEESRRHGSGAFRFEGQMVDAPVLHRAHSMLAQ